MKTRTLHGDFVLLGIEQLKIVLPQSAATTVAHLKDKNSARSHWLSDARAVERCIREHQMGFSALSSNLEILPSIPDHHFVITSFSVAPDVSWCWKEVQLLNDVNFEVVDFPPILKLKNTPMESLTTLEDGSQAYVCDPDKLLKCILQQ